jgi:hypothetical protein
MAKPIKRCVACLGSGRLLPECEPWLKFPGGECSVCSGMGRPDTVRQKSLSPGDIFQDINGNEYLLLRKNADGCTIVHQGGKNVGLEEYAAHNPAVRLIRRCTTAFF